MKKNNLIGKIFLGLGIMASMMACGNTNENNNADFPTYENRTKPAPKTTIQFESTFHDFGDIKEGDVVNTVYKFTNTGNSPLIIRDARASCGCTVPSKPEAPVMPGETGEIEVEFNSKGKPGMQSKTVTITANTEPSETIKLDFKAQVAKAE